MNKSPSTATLILLFVGVVASPLLAAEPTDRSAEADLRETIAELRTASVEGDTQKVIASMTDDYLQTDISGLVQNKDTWLKNYFIPVADLIKAGKFRWETYDLKDVLRTPNFLSVEQVLQRASRVSANRPLALLCPVASLASEVVSHWCR